MKGHGRALRLLLEIRQVILNFSLLHVSKLKTRELTEIKYLIKFLLQLHVVQVLSAYLTRDNDKVNLVCSGQPDSESHISGS